MREFCGNDLPSQPFIVGTGLWYRYLAVFVYFYTPGVLCYEGKFTLKFRTSFFDNFPGFRIFVTCFNGNEAIGKYKVNSMAAIYYMITPE